jgi:hypothetical protein
MMFTDQVITLAMKVFKQKVTEFCRTHGVTEFNESNPGELIECLKKAFAQSGGMTLKCFYESLDESAAAIWQGGERLGRKPAVEKEVLTPFGPIILSRQVYQAAQGGATVIPLDAKLGILKEYAVPEAREGLLFLIALMTPEEAHQALEKNALHAPSVTALRHMAERTGQEMEAQRDRLLEATEEQTPLPPQTEVLVVSCDGTSVPLRNTDEESGLGPTERKMAMTGVLSYYGPAQLNEEGQWERERLGALSIARMPEEKYPTFQRMFDATVARAEAKLPAGTTKILLCDAARALWNHFETQPAYADYLKLVDYYHMSEHLKRAAEALFGVGPPEAEQWEVKWKGRLLDEEKGAERLVRSLDYGLKTRTLSRSRREQLETERTFFARNKDKMNYASFRRRGLPIGSGPVEAACKTLIKSRLCQAGMRWSISGGQHVLTLRAYVKSGLWDVMWNQYLAFKKETMIPYAMAA